MKWDGISGASWMNSLRLRLIYSMLRRLRASCPELQAPGAHLLSRGDFYLAGEAGYPVAPPGYSAHEYGEAYDMVVTPMAALADVGATWQNWGGAWNPGDAVHFELPGASERARQRGEELDRSQAPFLVQLASSIPFGLSMGLIFDFFGIPSAARKNVTPEQEAYLRTLAQQYGLK